MAGLDLRDWRAGDRRTHGGWAVDPELAAAGTNAGGLGFLAAGYLSADALAERIAAARALTSGPARREPVRAATQRRDAEAIHRYARRWRPTPSATGPTSANRVSTTTTGRPSSRC